MAALADTFTALLIAGVWTAATMGLLVHIAKGRS
jgi:hypothetical protein